MGAEPEARHEPLQSQCRRCGQYIRWGGGRKDVSAPFPRHTEEDEMDTIKRKTKAAREAGKRGLCTTLLALIQKDVEKIYRRHQQAKDIHQKEIIINELCVHERLIDWLKRYG